MRTGTALSVPKATRTVSRRSSRVVKWLGRETSAGKYSFRRCRDGNTFRSLQPKGGFKRDRREGQLPARQKQGADKHIDLKALRNNGDPLKAEKGKRPAGKKLKKGARIEKKNK